MFGVIERKLSTVPNTKNSENRNLGYLVEHEENKAVSVDVVQQTSPSITSEIPIAVSEFPMETHV